MATKEITPATYMEHYIVFRAYIPDTCYVTDTYVIIGYEKAKRFYEEVVAHMCSGDEVALYTVRVSERGMLCRDELIVGTKGEG